MKEIIKDEEMLEVTGGQTTNANNMRDVGLFLIVEGSHLGVNDATVPAGCGLTIGDVICVCPESGEAKDVVGYHDYKSEYKLPVILVGRFLSENAFGRKQRVKTRVW